MRKIISLILVMALLLAAAVLVTSCGTEEERKLKKLNKLTFEEYQAMDSEQKKAYHNSYIELLGEDAGDDAYFEWYKKAASEYYDDQEREIIDDDDVETELGTGE